jgi:hypothetical protein
MGSLSGEELFYRLDVREPLPAEPEQVSNQLAVVHPHRRLTATVPVHQAGSLFNS